MRRRASSAERGAPPPTRRRNRLFSRRVFCSSRTCSRRVFVFVRRIDRHRTIRRTPREAPSPARGTRRGRPPAKAGEARRRSSRNPRPRVRSRRRRRRNDDPKRKRPSASPLAPPGRRSSLILSTRPCRDFPRRELTRAAPSVSPPQGVWVLRSAGRARAHFASERRRARGASPPPPSFRKSTAPPRLGAPRERLLRRAARAVRLRTSPSFSFSFSCRLLPLRLLRAKRRFANHSSLPASSLEAKRKPPPPRRARRASPPWRGGDAPRAPGASSRARETTRA
mmetsp:Transcript_130/g.527  ORF Transcript_130/g.527 Transcript_130/m.527 type:complete len:282 (+) Transcript_130:386-1231(+)